jgi:hypothetical protein
MSKQSVNLASGPVRVSRIRRDPPPVARKVADRDRDSDPERREARTVIIGILSFEIALFIIILGFSSYAA